MKKLKACMGNGSFFQKQECTISHVSFYNHLMHVSILKPAKHLPSNCLIWKQVFTKKKKKLAA